MRVRDEEKVQLVKQKALESLVQDGFEGFSMNKLAKACGISVATLYIYYKDKDDLIISIGQEEGDKMADAMIKNLDPKASFEEGMRIQWQNRYAYVMANPNSYLFFEQLRTSTYQVKFLESFMKKFKGVISEFMHNVVANGEIKPMPLEVFWSVAYAPLYSLIRFEREGQSIGGKPFQMTDQILWQTFDLVIKALKN
ncbi:TetR/AcrR family transcriptional regulator [Pedobacter frigiditerrae]|uniref:TetR/AcrR family transcriptional regulator n=1 Tax=Pedobacter frigiditerrae TaxID=2530452 RepID=A0A4R0N3I9_9SPHI|nr:TetR/AcrR family transcriptional regulator [Pedobacter frigiditerrae]TCC94335.1 TetR/AcrR family transcriptional regulator [Pedobacter frigiditerrae]